MIQACRTMEGPPMLKNYIIVLQISAAIFRVRAEKLLSAFIYERRLEFEFLT